MKKSIKETIVLFSKGAVIGVANIIPGVSGGTLAVVLGIYDRLIESIAKFFEKPEKRKEYMFFLMKIFCGAGIAILLLANLMSFLLENHFHKTMFAFMGLILGGIPLVIRSHGDMRIRSSRILAFILGIMLVLFISSGIATGSSDISVKEGGSLLSAVSLPLMFVSGFFAGGAMIVPGISGSFILVLLGQYSLILTAIKQFAVKPIAVLAIGAIIGILTFSKGIEICLEKIPACTYYFILGLIIASLYKIFPGFPVKGSDVFSCALTFFAGIGVSYFLSKVKT
ncbi:MAG: DUF368 domain-containing protein [Candidatus Omnitrophota bacterium]